MLELLAGKAGVLEGKEKYGTVSTLFEYLDN